MAHLTDLRLDGLAFSHNLVPEQCALPAGLRSLTIEKCALLTCQDHVTYAFSPLTALTSLNICTRRQPFEDFRLPTLTCLRELTQINCALVGDFPQLTSLRIQHTLPPDTNLPALAPYTSLRSLIVYCLSADIEPTRISLDGMGSLSRLDHVMIEDYSVPDLLPLVALTNLTSLNLRRSTAVGDLPDAFSALSSLRRLGLPIPSEPYRRSVALPSVLSTLTALRELFFQPPVSLRSLSCLQPLTQLTRIRFGNNTDTSWPAWLAKPERGY